MKKIIYGSSNFYKLSKDEQFKILPKLKTLRDYLKNTKDTPNKRNVPLSRQFR